MDGSEFNTWYGRTTSQQPQQQRQQRRQPQRSECKRAKERIETVRSMQFNWISKGLGVRIGAINDGKNIV